MKKGLQVGTLRMKATGQVVKWTKAGWKDVRKFFPEAHAVHTAYIAAGNEHLLLDSKDKKFLRGQLSPDGQPQGGRVTQLPTGEKLDKAFSLFSPHLRLHDQDSYDHWDVLYQNKGGTWSYCYGVTKKAQHIKQKYHKVHQFARAYSKLHQRVTASLKNKDDFLALPMYTLLTTHMRIGNEVYYKAHGHKGLTTLKKKDVRVKGKHVSFSFLAKDGVPRKIIKEFPAPYVKRLQSLLKQKKSEDFVFTHPKTGKPLHETHFKKAFQAYCGKPFYPHIVRSHYATTQVQEAIKGKRRMAKEEMQHLFMQVAHELGHSKFNKKTQQWEDSYAVTINHYVQPELVNRVKQLVQ